ncbi:MAG: 50S ribosomal protein L30 [Xanthomonadaceae bacterium]|nr:50S ribosomal protein L30 [Xanthomonadaceae bacterium]MDE1884650.1 50S ribosomal protein L30 [Xanthomonadaceae bacterium]MDE1960475.1 50S ribosomal protein L30 [Xanthomonadaceae bacterium]MDE2084937.1 50S ribosomal protein L30 [Xanthomonadaceae bacterium]MDE2258042.1 50S ribosomal protein L30 [Xanthomonadaceae bacterium]
MAKAKTSKAGTVRVRLYKSMNSCQWRHRLSVKALGLNKLNDVRELKDSPQVRGLVNKIGYLVRIEENA